MRQEILIINDINNRKEILEELRFFYTDEDFCGNNGKEFTREEALESGFVSTQDYVIDVLKNSGLTGKELVGAFFKQWLDKDGYYEDWEIETYEEDNGRVIFAIGIVTPCYT